MIVKCLSVKQPWAWLIIYGGKDGWKDVENRSPSFATTYRGRLYIHADKSFDSDGADYCISTNRISSEHTIDAWHQRGGIVGHVDLIDVVQDSRSKWAEFGNKHLLLANPVPIPFFPCKGQLGIFNVELP